MTTFEAVQTESRTPTLRSRFRKRMRNRNLAVGSGIVFVFVLAAIFGPALAPHDPLATNVGNSLLGPSGEHLLGTDRYGRDLASRLLVGARISLVVGLSVVTLSLIGGVLLGTIAGFFGRWVDRMLMLVIDALLAFPGFLLALALVAVAGSSLRNVIIAIAVAYTPRVAVVMRAVVMTLRTRPFIEAGRAAGVTTPGLILRHIIPNSLPPVIVVATVSAALAILAEAGLSFLGLGVQPPAPTWGNIIRDGLPYLVGQPWISFLGGLAVAIAVVGLNLLGDGLRDALDPHMQGATEVIE